MKTVVYDVEFEELEIKPRPALERYRALLADEMPRLMAGSRPVERACPGCLARRAADTFEIFGCRYVECAGCGTMYVTPAPDDETLAAFFRDSLAYQYWRNELWPQTRTVRERKVYAPQVDWVLENLDRHCPFASTLVDLSFHTRLFTALLLKFDAAVGGTVAAGPTADLECGDLQHPLLTVRPGPYGSLDARQADAIFALDALPRVSNTEAFFGGVAAALAPRGLLFLTAPSASGFEISVLRAHSPNLYPPDRLTVLTMDGLTAALERHGFDIIELSTPGVFDVDIVRRATDDVPGLQLPSFVQRIVSCEPELLQRFQRFLQEARLSSFARVVARKR